MDSAKQSRIAAHIEFILNELGLTPKRDIHLAETPARIARFLDLFLSPGLEVAPPIISAMDNEDGLREMIVLRSIHFYSLCAHHFLPFFGHIDIGYLPGRKLIGIGSLNRIVEYFARRPQIQERFSEQIASYLDEVLRPRGTIVRCQARHLCLELPIYSGQETRLETIAARGALQAGAERAQFLGHPGR